MRADETNGNLSNIPSGKLIMMSAPVRSAPQRNPPPPGDVASWLSRKSQCVLRFGVRNLDSTAPVIMRAKGRMKKGVEVLMSGKVKTQLESNWDFPRPPSRFCLALVRKAEGGGKRDGGWAEDRPDLLLSNNAMTRNGIRLPSA